MAASRSDVSSLTSTVVVESAGAHLHVSTGSVELGRNGFVFRSPRPFSLWTEMTVALDAPGKLGRVDGEGVVVACEGNRHQGYMVSVLLLNAVAPAGHDPLWGEGQPPRV